MPEKLYLSVKIKMFFALFLPYLDVTIACREKLCGKNKVITHYF